MSSRVKLFFKATVEKYEQKGKKKVKGTIVITTSGTE